MLRHTFPYRHRLVRHRWHNCPDGRMSGDGYVSILELSQKLGMEFEDTFSMIVWDLNDHHAHAKGRLQAIGVKQDNRDIIIPIFVRAAGGVSIKGVDADARLQPVPESMVDETGGVLVHLTHASSIPSIMQTGGLFRTSNDSCGRRELQFTYHVPYDPRFILVNPLVNPIFRGLPIATLSSSLTTAKLGQKVPSPYRERHPTGSAP